MGACQNISFFYSHPLWNWVPMVAQRVKHLPAMRETQVRFLGQEDLLGKEMQSTPALLPGKYHGWRSLIGYGPWGHNESDTTEWFHFTSLHFNNGLKNNENDLRISLSFMSYWFLLYTFCKMPQGGMGPTLSGKAPHGAEPRKAPSHVWHIPASCFFMSNTAIS